MTASDSTGTERRPGDRACACRVIEEGVVLRIDATACPRGGRLGASPACRRTVIGAADGGLEALAVVAAGRERTYRDRAPAILSAAATFATRIEPHDDRLARRARRSPLAVASDAANRAGPARRLADQTGLAAIASESWTCLRPRLGLSWSHWRARPDPPPGQLATIRELDTGATVRIYEPSDGGSRRYMLEPVTRKLGPTETSTLAAAHASLAAPTDPADRPWTAVRAAATEGTPITILARSLRKHTRQGGRLADFFADPEVSDVFVTAPVTANPVRVRVDGERLETNWFLTTDGRDALASWFRQESGRGFSRASPTLDASTTIGDRRIRLAGVTEPVSAGAAFVFRAHDRDAWTLDALVRNGTLSAHAAGLLSLAVERGTAGLIAGPRGSGKTTLLGALLWELPDAVRTVAIEDTRELPIDALQTAGRDVQGLHADDDGPLEPVAALRAALRLGDGALVLGEVRGTEAAALYEAMRVGANSEAVLGTIHGDGTSAVLERVVSDLGVAPSAFATTDLVVTLETAGTRRQPRRRVRTIEEVHGGDPVEFATLFERTDDRLEPTGRLARGNSHLLAGLTRPAEHYESALEAMAAAADRFERPIERTTTAGGR